MLEDDDEDHEFPYEDHEFPYEENCRTNAFLGVAGEVLNSGITRSSLSFSVFGSGFLSQVVSSTALKKLGSSVC